MTGDNAHVEAAARQRAEAAGVRAVQLAARAQELQSHQIPSRTGSPTEQAMRAAEQLRVVADERAADARNRAAAAYVSAACAHERAAALFERLAQTGLGNVDQLRQRATEHREAGEADRRRATQDGSDVMSTVTNGIAAGPGRALEQDDAPPSTPDQPSPSRPA